MRKKSLLIISFIITSLLYNNLYSFEEGFIWGLRANFNGVATIPSISSEDLDKMGAANMKGAIGYTMDGEAELGYLFGAERWFNREQTQGIDVFSGMSLYVSIGVGSGFSGIVSGNTIDVATVNVFMNVNYKPVISFGIGSKLYLLESRMAIGIQLGGKLIADTSPEYLAYSDTDETFKNLSPPVELPEMGEIIVTDFMKKNMNPIMFSMKFMLEYNQPINDRVEVVLGAYTRFNIYKPKYITMPSSLLGVIKNIRTNFTAETPMNSLYLNSIDFGLSLGLQFRG